MTYAAAVLVSLYVVFVMSPTVGTRLRRVIGHSIEVASTHGWIVGSTRAAMTRPRATPTLSS